AKEGGQEIIIATNPTVDGDVTALYLQRILSQQISAKITRLASGLPVGGDLEYADRLTFARSFRGRTEI
ncbi:MAG: toprim domain-containing protein, partial [Ruminococcus flavefaciens]|nr:toprim domain-containing protein [Ruminococcus flavefaciens]